MRRHRYCVPALLALVLVLGAACTVLPVLAGKGPQYRYGDTWWQEYRSDEGTELLLHFGPPQVSGREKLVEAIEDRKQEESLGVDLDELEGGGANDAMDVIPAFTPDEFKLPPVDESKLAPGTLADYSDKRQTVKLPEGMAVVPEGRFGKGLRCGGSGRLRAVVENPRAVECWIRVDAYPEEPSCILAMGSDDCRLLLHPDGRLELKLARPHGEPGAYPGLKEKPSPEAIKALFMKDATIMSPDPIPTDTWTHVVIWDQPHPTPGGGEPWDARLKVNGFDVAWYLSERYNENRWLGGRKPIIAIGSNAEGSQGFAGDIDEVRVSSKVRVHYERPALPWRDVTLARPLQFDRPWFRENGTVFHASLDRGLEYDLHKGADGRIAVDLMGEGVEGMHVPGIRGKGWVIDPNIGFPRFSIEGMSAVAGALEFWLRPVNWDDVTGYWHHSPPKRLHLSVARLYGRDKRNGEVKTFMTVALPRAFNLERQRIPLDPGHWVHVVMEWSAHNLKGGGLYFNGKWHGGVRRAAPEVLKNMEPLHVEFGMPDDVTVKLGEKPRIEIDEVVGYNCWLREDEAAQAYRRWQGKLEPIKLYTDRLDFKYSIQKLAYTLQPLLPEGQEAKSLSVSLVNTANGDGLAAGPFNVPIINGHGRAVMWDGPELQESKYRIDIRLADAAGKPLVETSRDWTYKVEPWRHYDGGILNRVPPPWTPIAVAGDELRTRMTTYRLGGDGLPVEIVADGKNILSGTVQLLEAGKPLRGKATPISSANETEATWRAAFAGERCNATLTCHLEYDGMIRYELKLKPTQQPVKPMSLVFPLDARHATRFLHHALGARGVSAGTIGEADGTILESRAPSVPWREYQKAKKKNRDLSWEQYKADYVKSREAYGFFGHIDVNDMNRGLFWFCDNAAGWAQSRTVSAIELVRRSDTVSLVLNLVAEPVEYEAGRPIVFGILPHPAKPLPGKYRLYERVSPSEDRWACSIYDAFRPWPMDPKAGGMKLFPATDPRNPDAGASWDYAERCIPSMEANKPSGYRTMYLSRLWFSCRTGAYDNWEWRSGHMSGTALTPYFNNYLCWEMNEWIGRGIWDAVYLDECYETALRNQEAGFSITLPDGTEQSGLANFAFRDLMKRWRNLFHAHGREPMLLAHHTRSWQYQGLVFCDSCLDGENTPIVSLQSRDWIDSTSKTRFEVIQNCGLWGIANFYMPFIAEGGFNNKEKSSFPVWQWRMARQAQSQFAHYEVATTYQGQGAQVYKAFWSDVLGWGAGDPAVPFVPYWNTDGLLDVDDQGGDTLVSFYRKPGEVLLIASNRRKEDVTAEIALDLKALGLGSGLSVRDVDSSFARPAGEDYLGAAAVNEEAAGTFMETGGELLGIEEELGADAIEELLTDPDELVAKARAAEAPKLEGNRLSLPIRARDFRLVAIE